MLETLTSSMFAANVNSTFQVRHQAGEPVALELVEYREGVSQPGYEHFSLLFKGPRTVVLPQQTYQMEHPVLGTFALFLVPVRQDENATYYESVFNRLLQQRIE